MRSRLLIAAAFLVCLAGCGHLATPEEKEASFAPYAGRMVGPVSLRQFLEARTAILVAGATPETLELRDGEIGVKLHPTSADGTVDVGSATAIFENGYYLTAAHCLRRTPVFLLVRGKGSIRAWRARVVWSPGTDDPRYDIALIHISGKSAHVFEEYGKPTQTALVTTGANGEAAGRLLQFETGREDGNGMPRVDYVTHDAPLSHGDSGGPLAMLDGKLVGIEVLVRGIVFGPQQGVALAVDRDWLLREIESDEAAHPAVKFPEVRPMRHREMDGMIVDAQP